MSSQDEIEIQEAIDAADEALDYLYDAQSSLKQAGGWGIADILGGGFFISMIKRNHMQQAKIKMDKAQRALQNFSKELDDIAMYDQFNFDNNGFMSFADYFFDNSFVDIMVQTKIQESLNQVQAAIDGVRQIQDELVILLDQVAQDDD